MARRGFPTVSLRRGRSALRGLATSRTARIYWHRKNGGRCCLRHWKHEAIEAHPRLTLRMSFFLLLHVYRPGGASSYLSLAWPGSTTATFPSEATLARTERCLGVVPRVPFSLVVVTWTSCRYNSAAGLGQQTATATSAGLDRRAVAARQQRHGVVVGPFGLCEDSSLVRSRRLLLQEAFPACVRGRRWLRRRAVAR